MFNLARWLVKIAHLKEAAGLLRAPHSNVRRLVVVHAGARDSYQVASALQEENLLEALVTDAMWSASNQRWARSFRKLAPAQVLSLLKRRNAPLIPASRVHQKLSAGLQSIFLDRAKYIPFRLRQLATRSADARLGRAAGRLANRRHAGLLSYSYYGYEAFRKYQGPGILFQVHPHPVSVRRILLRELADHPDCAESLTQEWELSLSDSDFSRLANEPALAARFLCASSFTRSTLVENGVTPDSIRVVPYGVDGESFRPDQMQRSTAGRLKILFVGRINQRKGLKYLLEALRLLRTDAIDVTICGRVVDSLELFRPFADRISIRPSVSAAELRAAYQSADLFVFPSVAEGFGQVLLESLASGLPILSTTHTAAPDLIRDGEAGFIVEPRRPDSLAEKIDWAATHREDLLKMRGAARDTANVFSWQRFRKGIVEAVRDFNTELYPNE